MNNLSKFNFQQPTIWLMASALLLASFGVSQPLITEAEEAPSNIIDIEAGDGFTSILEENGSVWTWGRNDGGQLGLGDKVDRYSPEKIPPTRFDSPVVSLSSGLGTVLARTQKGNVYLWGNNTTTPVRIYSLGDSIQTDLSSTDITGGHNTYHVLSSNGQISSSGSSYYGGFGQGASSYGSVGTCTNSYSVGASVFTRQVLREVVYEPCASNPAYNQIVSSTPLDNITQFSSSMATIGTVALTSDNKLYYWGRNNSMPALARIPAGIEIEQVSYSNKIWFLTKDKKVYRYDNNASLPIEVPMGNSTVFPVEISGALNHTLFLMSDGSVWGTGTNSNGQLGPNISLSGTSSVFDTGLRNIKLITAGMSHSVVVTNDNKIQVLGSNNFGELASENDNLKKSFTLNTYLPNVKDIHAVGHTSFAATSDNKFWAWGESSVNFRSGPDNLPVVSKDFSTISSIKKLNGNGSTGLHGSLLLDNGDIYTFGGNYRNGNGRTGNAYVPGKLVNTQDAFGSSNTKFVDAMQGSYNGIAANEEGKIFTWGHDLSYNLGLGYQVNEWVNGAFESRGLNAFVTPVVDPSIFFTQVFTGDNDQKYAIDLKGDVYVWGGNPSSSLGMSGTYRTPTKLTSIPEKVVSIATGGDYAIFLDEKGSLWSIGSNPYGNLGLGHTNNVSTPTKISALADIKIKKIFAETATAFALAEDGTLYAWGDNRYGQLGLGDLVQRNAPRVVSDFVGKTVKEVAPATKHTMLLLENGELYVAGSDGYGQLGLQQSSINAEPIIVIFPPVVTIGNSNNQSFTINNDLAVQGDIQSKNEGINVNITYSIDSINGVLTQGTIKNYTTGSIPEPYQLNLDFDNYALGNYTLHIKATTDTGVSGESYINFKIEDRIPPTISHTFSPNTVNNWKTENVYFDVSADDVGGSGFSNFKYALTASSAKPTVWDATYSEKTKRIPVTRSGIFYLHLEAYDGDGNTTYARSGPYQIDQAAPVFNFTQSAAWQQESLSLGVSTTDASALIQKKWMSGTPSLSDIKTSGTNFTSSTITVSQNGFYSFYALDENGQETLSQFEVTNINKKPTLTSAQASYLIPYRSKSSATIPVRFTHPENSDASGLKFGDNSYQSTNVVSGVKFNTPETFVMNLAPLTENMLHSKSLVISDSRGGVSNPLSTQIEVYNPGLKGTNKIEGMRLDWTGSKLGTSYKLFRNGVEIVQTNQTSFLDTDVPKNTTPIYTLKVLHNGTYVEVDQLSKTYKTFHLATPNSITFPTIQLGDVSHHPASSIDLPYVEFEDESDVKTGYTLRVSMSDFHSATQPFTPTKAFIKPINVENNNGIPFRQTSVIPLNSSGFDVLQMNSEQVMANPFVRLSLPASLFELQIPNTLSTEGNSVQEFTSEITWDIVRTP